MENTENSTNTTPDNNESLNKKCSSKICSEFKCPFGIEWGKLINRSKDVITDPRGVWTDVQNDNYTVVEIYKHMALPLGIVGMLTGMLQAAFSGYFSWMILRFSVLGLIVSLLMIYVASFVAKFLAPKFGGKEDLMSAMKLFVNSSIPTTVASLVMILPIGAFISGLIHFAGSIFSLYVLWQGITPMLNIPQEKKLAFYGANVAIMLLIGLVISSLVFGGVMMSGV